MSWKRVLPVLMLAVLVSATSAMAQPDKPWKWIFGHFYGGVSLPQAQAGDSLSDGWSFGGGVTLKKENWPVAFVADLAYNDLPIKQDALWVTDDEGDTAKVADSGSFDVWSLTGDLMWQPKTKGAVGFYLQGGVGAYYVSGSLSNSVWVPGWTCGFYWCAPGYWPADAIVGSTSSWEWGYNAGVGVTFNLNSDSQIFLQLTYHWIQTDPTGEYVPIVIGYRW